MSDEIEVIGVYECEDRKRKYPTNVKKDLDGIEIDKLCEKLRRKLLNCESYWLRKSTLLTEEVCGRIPSSKLMFLQLEMGIHFRDVNEIVSAVKYLHKNCQDDEEFRTRVEELNKLTEENRGKPFAAELLSRLEPSIFLEPLLGSARTTLEKLQALIALAKTVGMRQVGKKIYNVYINACVEKASNSEAIVDYDLIWFHLSPMLCDDDLCGFDPGHAFIIYQAMLRCCSADARGQLNKEFFAIYDSFGFSRIKPRDPASWRLCLRLLIEYLYCHNIANMLPLIQYLKNNFETLSFVQISQRLIDDFKPTKYEEISKFLLSYSICMKEFYEGGNYSVYMPAKLFDVSKRAIKSFWSANTQAREEVGEDEIDFKSILRKNPEQYLEILSVASNVYLAYQNLNDRNEIQYNLGLMLQTFQLPNAFATIGQSLLVSGKFAESAKFIKNAVRMTKNKDEQTILLFQLLEANVAMRKTKQVLLYALDLLNEKDLVKKSVEKSIGLLRNQRFEDDCFVQIPKDCFYHYVVLSIFNASVISFTKWQEKDNKDLMNLSATIIVLTTQCLWPFCVDMLKDVFELLDEEISILNVIKMISNRILFTKLCDTKVNFVEGSKILKLDTVLNKFQKERMNKEVTRLTAFEDLALYISSHNVAKDGTSIIQLLFT